MDWLARAPERRADPRVLWPEKAPKRYEERVIARGIPMEGRRDRPRNSPSAAIAFENGIGQARETDSHM